jgi:hypothetical protein
MENTKEHSLHFAAFTQTCMEQPLYVCFTFHQSAYLTFLETSSSQKTNNLITDKILNFLNI